MIHVKLALFLSLSLCLVGCAPNEQTKPAETLETPAASGEPKGALPVSAPPMKSATPATAAPVAKAEVQGEIVQAGKNPNGVSMAECRMVCAHILQLSLKALPEDVPPDIREAHTAKLTRDCPPGCMSVATPESNTCVLKAKTAQDMAACQP
ncbi:MAG: hypothetical protein ACPGU1_07395 [Myxococcota bacterium]